jgi:hypothetical protein
MPHEPQGEVQQINLVPCQPLAITYGTLHERLRRSALAMVSSRSTISLLVGADTVTPDMSQKIYYRFYRNYS